LSVLDWGGGLGHYWALARSALPGLELEYHVKETPAVCARGREVAPGVTFHDGPSCLDRQYDLVVASSSLQYAEDWRALLAGLAGAAGSHLYVARVPVALAAGSFVVLQRAHAYGYETEYLGWVLNRHELLETAAAAGLSLAREFLLDARFSAENAPEVPVAHRSFLFNR
jgi:putative methyltransferase (TIGR04325 family)